MRFNAPIPLLVVDIWGIPAGVIMAIGWCDCRATGGGWDLVCKSQTSIAGVPAGIPVRLKTLADQELYARGLSHLHYPA